MTREEIIQGLQFTIDMFLFDPTTGETFKEPRNDMDKTTIDSCREAIKALSQESCEDAISREDALMCMTGEYLVDKEYKPEDIISKHIRRLRALPSVKPKYNASEWCHDCSEYDHEKHCCPRYNGVIRKAVEEIKEPKIKTGHWIPKTKNWWECSECGRMIYSETESDKLKFHAFCGRCGAKMESEDKE